MVRKVSEPQTQISPDIPFSLQCRVLEFPTKEESSTPEHLGILKKGGKENQIRNKIFVRTDP